MNIQTVYNMLDRHVSINGEKNGHGHEFNEYIVWSDCIVYHDAYSLRTVRYYIGIS